MPKNTANAENPARSNMSQLRSNKGAQDICTLPGKIFDSVTPNFRTEFYRSQAGPRTKQEGRKSGESLTEVLKSGGINASRKD
jgi:hypothetical protein